MMKSAAKRRPGQHRQLDDVLYRRLRWEDLDPSYLKRLAQLARDEDLHGIGLCSRPHYSDDVTTRMVDPKRMGRARIVARNATIICGLRYLPTILEVYGKGAACHSMAHDGEAVSANSTVAEVEGPASILLQAERVLLNFLQHLSGISSTTQAHVREMGKTSTHLLDTRKTTPGFRVLEKYAVARGGGYNHRMGLFDQVLIKDNHLAVEATPSGERISQAVARARAHNPDLVIEVEVDLMTQIEPVIHAGADMILLDNFDSDQLKAAVQTIDHRVYTEASGGITMGDLATIGNIGLDFISCGSITHQSRWQDIGLDWVH